MARRKNRKKQAKRQNQQAHNRPATPPAHSGATPPSPSPAVVNTKNASRQSLAQKRAADALRKIKEMKAGKERDPEKGDYGKYTSYVSALPAMILMSGLGQAMAMVRSRKLAGYSQLYDHLQGWLCGGRPYAGDDLINAIVQGSEADYIRAQAEALAYLEWLKKFAVALLDEPAGQQEEGADVAAS